MDFAYKVRRTSNGVELFRQGCPQHQSPLLDEVFRACLQRYFFEVKASHFEDDLTFTHGYVITGTFALILAEKPNQG